MDGMYMLWSCILMGLIRLDSLVDRMLTYGHICNYQCCCLHTLCANCVFKALYALSLFNIMLSPGTIYLCIIHLYCI